MAQEHTVRIIKRGHKPCKIINGHQLVIKKNTKIPADTPDTLVFKSNKKDVVIFFPDDKIFGEHVYKLNNALGYEKTLNLQINAPEDFFYFAIWSEDDGDFAEANSNPSIIIED